MSPPGTMPDGLSSTGGYFSLSSVACSSVPFWELPEEPFMSVSLSIALPNM